ncbi:GUN4 domain-containing protein, partial [Desmonostoc muscorum CCALA 125]|nr:GUN4 domain-containing protein [Desmonostoc muscorum CCALA 125]
NERPKSMQAWLNLLVDQTPSDDLSSEVGVDYRKLRDYLAAGNWKDADNETYLVMLQAVGRKEHDWIREKEFLNFPCKDLRTIDRLWVKYSNGRFGFSVQKEIYLSVGGKLDGKYDKEAWEKFRDTYGSSELNAFVGCRRRRFLFGSFVRFRLFSSLASRLVKCNI